MAHIISVHAWGKLLSHGPSQLLALVGIVGLAAFLYIWSEISPRAWLRGRRAAKAPEDP